MITEDKPSLDDTLEHFGVKGMRWGVRQRARGPQIRAARRNVATANIKYEGARANLRAVKKTGSAAQVKAAEKNVAKQKMAFLNHPDRPTAARLTRGETIATAILFTPVTTAAIIGTTQVVSRRIEAKQIGGHYNKG